MRHPRIVAVVSAVAASTVAFLVVSRWRLAGTLAGAALIPLIYTLVSHWSSASLDHAANWLRPRVSRTDECEEPAGSCVPTRYRVSTKHRVLIWDPKRTQWLLVGLVSLALAGSLYALASRSPGEREIVRERVVQEMVTVTVPTHDSGSTLSGESAPSAVDPGETAKLEESSSTTTEPATTTTVTAMASTTTVSTPASATTESPVSTTSPP